MIFILLHLQKIIIEAYTPYQLKNIVVNIRIYKVLSMTQ
jgi:hypothetical protein